MDLALRLLVACFVIIAPSVLFLGLVRGLEKLRDDALLLQLAERDDVPEDVSNAAAQSLETGPIRADGDGSTRADEDGSNGVTAIDPAPTPDTRVCPKCGESNMYSAKFCGACLGELNR